jgi:DNA-binding transcriptional MerR regulator
MTRSQAPLWTLDELSAQVVQALMVDYPGQVNGQVREVPDIRTIRFYTTRGLIDRPAQMHGRTALYGERHLLQLVAIKRLQAKGLTLAEIQKQVGGQSNRKLRELARLPVHRHQTVETDAADHHQTEQTAEDRRRGRFWEASPAPVPEGETNTERTEEMQKKRGPDVQSLTGVALEDGVTLLLQAARPLDEQDVEALRSAAAPLLKLLRLRRMI